MPPTKVKRGLILIVIGPEGVGKTTLGAHAPKSVMLMARGETGYTTLYNYDRVPACPQLLATKWEEVRPAVQQLTSKPDDTEYLVLDALSGFERLCHEYTCRVHFGNDWSETGFASYQKGYERAVGEWLLLLADLDRMRCMAGINILWLSHCKIETFKNPTGLDYDRFVADCHKKTWAATHKDADAVLFNTFHTIVQTGGDKQIEAGKRPGKGIGGTERRVYTEKRDTYDAKNRLGMPEMIQLPNDPTKSWDAISRHIFKEQK